MSAHRRAHAAVRGRGLRKRGQLRGRPQGPALQRSTGSDTDRALRGYRRGASLALAEDGADDEPDARRGYGGGDDAGPVEYRHQARLVVGDLKHTHRLHAHRAAAAAARPYALAVTVAAGRPDAGPGAAAENIRHQRYRDDGLPVQLARLPVDQVNARGVAHAVQ